MFGLSVLAQDVQITGKVTSADDGAGLPGVSVVIKGTTMGTSTNIDGEFTMTVSPEATLVFSTIGMKAQEIPVGNQTAINVAMEMDVTGLEEVVVTALGISREKKALGYSVQEVGEEAVNTVKTDNFVKNLSGKISGVQITDNGNFGGGVNILVRGSTSISGNNQPLFVIDGVPVDNNNTNNDGQTKGRSGFDYGNAASDLNPADIESISILKGAQATALYGSRAANGVVMVNTKKGKYGQGIGVDFSISASIGFYDKSTFPEYQKEYGQGYGSGYSDGDYDRLFEFDGDLYAPTTEDASYGQAFDENLMVYNWNSFYENSPYYGQKTPWLAGENGPEYFLQNPTNTTTSLGISGGSETTAYRLNYTNLRSTGLLPNSNLLKHVLTFNGSHKILSNLTASSSVTYTNLHTKGRNETGYSDNLMSGFRQWWATNVDLKEQEELYNNTGENATWNMHDLYNGDDTPEYWNNPYWQRNESYETDSKNRILGYAKLDWEATTWMSFMGRVGVDYYSVFQEERKQVGSVSGEFGVERPEVTSGYARYNREFIEANYDFMANLHKNFGDFSTALILGTNFRRSEWNNILSSTNGGLSVPGLWSLSNSVSTMLPPEEENGKIGVNGYFTSLNIGYKNFLYLDASYRYDISSTLPSDNWSYGYPSITGSWIFSEQIDASWLSFGKIRAGYAEVGNATDYNKTQDSYVIMSPFSGNPVVRNARTANNSELEPERSKSVETGIELSFLQSRLGMDVTYYNSNTENQIISTSVPYETGFRYRYVNAGIMHNEGVEISLNATPVIISDFRWNINVNWSKNKNKVKELYTNPETGEKLSSIELASPQGGVTIVAREGESYPTILGTDYVYDSLNGKRIVDQETGAYEKTSSSAEVIGHVTPNYNMGINNTLSYKNISLSFLIDIQQGGSVFSLDQYYGQATGIYANTVGTNYLGNKVRDPLIQNADGTYDAASGGYLYEGSDGEGNDNKVMKDASDYSGFGYKACPNAQFVYDASYVKLREVTITYNFPSSLMDKTPIKRASLSLVGSNLWIIHKNLPYADPEASQSNGNIRGWQSGVMPTTRNFGFNLNINF